MILTIYSMKRTNLFKEKDQHRGIERDSDPQGQLTFRMYLNTSLMTIYLGSVFFFFINQKSPKTLSLSPCRKGTG